MDPSKGPLTAVLEPSRAGVVSRLTITELPVTKR